MRTRRKTLKLTALILILALVGGTFATAAAETGTTDSGSASTSIVTVVSPGTDTSELENGSSGSGTGSGTAAETAAETPTVVSPGTDTSGSGASDTVTGSEGENNSGTETGTEVAPEKKPASTFEDFTDIKGHWSEEAMKKAFSDGILKGFEDSTIRPDDIITPAQMITIITRILNTSGKSEVKLEDDCWYKDAAAQALSLGIISEGDVDSLNEPMKRKDACIMMSDAFQLTHADPGFSKAATYDDFSKMSLGDRVAIASLVNSGYIQGYNGSLTMESSITRAEFVTILYRVAGKYLKSAEVSDVSALAEASVLSGDSISISGKTVQSRLWLDAQYKSISISNTNAPEITIRSDKLEQLSISGGKIDRLVIASRTGDINLNCACMGTAVIGDGDGSVTLTPSGSDIEITGDSRVIDIVGKAETVSISGDGNTVNLAEGADVNKLVINGCSNVINLDSTATAVVNAGSDNSIKGNGLIGTATIKNADVSISVKKNKIIYDITENTDPGIKYMDAQVTASDKIDINQYLKAAVTFSNEGSVSGKTVDAVWTVNDKEVRTDSVTLTEGKKSTMNYWVSYQDGMPDKIKVGCIIRYKDAQGKVQEVEAEPAYSVLNKKSEAYIYAMVNAVQSEYKGDKTSQWAADNDMSKEQKEGFVNNKGYSSTTKYLVWVNAGTQHVMVFEGSKGKWTLSRSGIATVGTDKSVPQGTYKVTYKQETLTTAKYTVNSIVRFSEGYTISSLQYEPGTTTLIDNEENVIGVPGGKGSVKMEAEEAQWIYKNVPNGTTVVVY